MGLYEDDGENKTTKFGTKWSWSLAFYDEFETHTHIYKEIKNNCILKSEIAINKLVLL